MPVEFEPFDISEHLDNEEMIAGYLNAAAEDEDPNVLLVALADAAKARGMMQVAKDAGLSRVSLYRALKIGAHRVLRRCRLCCAHWGSSSRWRRGATSACKRASKG